MDLLIYILILIGLIFLFIRIFRIPIKIISKIILNSIIGVSLLLLANYFGEFIDLNVELNSITFLVSILLGIPGVLFLFIFKYFI